MLNQMAVGLPQFAEDGLACFRDDWLALDELRGLEVAVSQGGRAQGEESITGLAAGIDADGAFLLQTEAGLRTFMAGDVSVRKWG